MEKESNYDAYITKISTIAKEGTTGASDRLVCVAGSGTNQELVDSYCPGFIGAAGISTHDILDENYEATENNFFVGGRIPGSSDTSSLTIKDYMPINITEGYRVAPGESIYAVILIGDYSDNTIPDGNFKMYIPAIQFDFSTTKPASNN